MRLAHILLPAVLAAGLLTHAAWANPRPFPADSYQVQVTSIADPYVVVDNNTTVQMGAGVLIFGPTNTTVVRNQLPVGDYVRMQFDSSGLVRRIWILTDEEIVQPSFVTSVYNYIVRPKTALPVPKIQ